MIQIHALTALLAIEGLVVMGLALLFVLFGATRRHKTERRATDALIHRINEADAANPTGLSAALTDPSLGLGDDQRQHILSELSKREVALYRLVIQAFLHRDTNRLAELDHHVRALSEPFQELTQQLAQTLPQPHDHGEFQLRLQIAELESQKALIEVARLTGQLTAALATLDEVSNEYAKMFAEPQYVEELHASRRRVLEAFRRSEAMALGELPSIHDAPSHLNHNRP